MKLYFQEKNFPWQPERYRYAAEQMLLTLFPGERPEYPAGPPPRDMGRETSAAVFVLRRGEKLTTVSALVFRPQGRRSGAARFPSGELDRSPRQVYHTIQHALKLAFYKAGTALLEADPPWGALTGVRPVKLPTRAMLAGATPRQAQRELERVYFVSPPRARLAVDCARASLRARAGLRPGQVSLYVGIPFCPTRCAYCSFVSADVGRSLGLVEPFLALLTREIEEAGAALGALGLSVRTVYMGGGTPTTLTAPQLDALLGALRRCIDLSQCTEFTVEAGRPDTITAEKLAVLRSHGADRISVNPQSMDDAVLAAMGRSHTAGDILRAWELVRSAGFPCVNMDLIAGLPADSPAGFRASLECLTGLGPENITVHTLALKKGSRLMTEGGALPGGEEVAAMLEFAWGALEDAGYGPYYLYRQKYMSGSFENVGWARPGFENLYNLCMMEELHSVVALGGGGVTKLVDPQGGRIVRLSNPKYPYEYLSSGENFSAKWEKIAAFQAGAGEEDPHGLSAAGD